MMEYLVNAGKLETTTDWTGSRVVERNYKYSDNFSTFEEAFEAWLSCLGYDFHELLIKTNKLNHVNLHNGLAEGDTTTAVTYKILIGQITND